MSGTAQTGDNYVDFTLHILNKSSLFTKNIDESSFKSFADTVTSLYSPHCRVFPQKVLSWKVPPDSPSFNVLNLMYETIKNALIKIDVVMVAVANPFQVVVHSHN